VKYLPGEIKPASYIIERGSDQLYFKIYTLPITFPCPWALEEGGYRGARVCPRPCRDAVVGLRMGALCGCEKDRRSSEKMTWERLADVRRMHSQEARVHCSEQTGDGESGAGLLARGQECACVLLRLSAELLTCMTDMPALKAWEKYVWTGVTGRVEDASLGNNRVTYIKKNVGSGAMSRKMRGVDPVRQCVLFPYATRFRPPLRTVRAPRLSCDGLEKVACSGEHPPLR
jgi:hypothetical protein